MRDRAAQETIQKVLEIVPTTTKQLAMVFAKSEIGHTTNAQEIINYDLDIDLNKAYTPTEEEFIRLQDEQDDAANNKPIKKVHNVLFISYVLHSLRPLTHHSSYNSIPHNPHTTFHTYPCSSVLRQSDRW